MRVLDLESIQRDDLAMAMAQAVALANEAAMAQGTDPSRCLVTVREQAPPPGRVWCVHYGPRDLVHRRGGDLIVYVDESTSSVQRVMRGQ